MFQNFAKSFLFQDLSNCVKPETVLDAMDVDQLRTSHKVHIVGTQIPDKGQRKGLWRLYELLAFTEKKCYITSNNTSDIVELKPQKNCCTMSRERSDLVKT